ncbi:MAG: DUF3445 domain-containing protein [Bacteriovorax sp.]|nr:DUF3445 domain-containing protein [Bacteriovorax sp.]
MNKQPLYFPIERGLYEVAPGLRPLGHDFGNGSMDKKIFQITDEFPIYRKNMLDCREERLNKYFITLNLSDKRAQTLTKFIVLRLVEEYPELFSLENNILYCSHTGDTIEFDQNFNLKRFSSLELIKTPVTHPIDALSLQVPEDLALVCREEKDNAMIDHLAMLHLCSSSHWAAEDKIGRNFFDIHTIIPGIDKINRVAEKMVETIILKGPFVRFIWSFVTDKRLNHHPIAPEGMNQVIWTGRTFNEFQYIPFYFRIERQTTFGFAEDQSSLFTIGVSFLTGHEVRNDPHMRDQLISALLSMTPESRAYKGVEGCFDQLLKWLQSSE